MHRIAHYFLENEPNTQDCIRENETAQGNRKTFIKSKNVETLDLNLCLDKDK
jgi:hypothetical protein